MMNIGLIRNTVCILLVSTMYSAHGGEKEDALIDKITTRYGGEALTDLSSYTIDVSFLAPTTGQSRTPDLVHMNRVNQILSVDVKANKASLDALFDGRGGGGPNGTITDGTTAWAINYQDMTFAEAPSPDLYTFGGGTMRTTDAILVYESNKVRDKAEYLGSTDYMNRPHDKLKIPFPQSPDLILFVDAETHLISKMVRVNPALGTLDYIFSNYQEHNGITYAAAVNFFVAGEPNLISTRHEVRFNLPEDESRYELSAELSKEGERIDTSEMIVNRISAAVYHVGTGNAYSTFVDTGDFIVAAGGYPGLKDRFNKFQSESGIHKPLRYQVVTHHHADHLGGLGEALDLGATLVTVDENVQAIRDGAGVEIADGQFLKTDGRMTLGGGRNRVEIYEVSTIHAASFLLTYVPSEKLLFMADHLGSPLRTGVPTANLNTVTMFEALKDLDLDVKRIAVAHGARIFTWKDMANSVAQYKPFTCTNALAICRSSPPMRISYSASH